MSQGKRGQASTEYVMIIGIILVLLIPLFWYAWHRTNQDVKENQVTDCVQSLAQGADEVYSLSPGSKKYITCNIPGSVSAWDVQQNQINMKLSTSGDHVAFTKGNVVQGDLSKFTQKGTYRIPVELQDDGTVLIGEGGAIGGPLMITWTWPEDDTQTCNPVVLRANTNRGSDCRYGLEGEPAVGGGNVGSSTRFDNLPHDMEGKTLSHHASLGALAEGTYKYWVDCKAPDGTLVTPATEDIRFSILFVACGGSTAPPTFEEDPPTVTLIDPGKVFPEYHRIDGTNDIYFHYQVDDASNILWCELFVDDVNDNNEIFELLDFDSRKNYPSGTIPKGPQVPPNELYAKLDRSRYNWTVNCTDNWGNVGEGFFPPPPAVPELKRFLNFNVTKAFDILGPDVTQIAPINGDPSTYPSTTFIYRANDADSGVQSCIVNITKYPMKAGASCNTAPCPPVNQPSDVCDLIPTPPVFMPNIRLFDGEITEGADESTGTWLDRGCYLWNVFCYDDSPQRNRGLSPDGTWNHYGWWYYQYTVLLNNQFGTGAGMSCVTYCIQHGFTGSTVCGLPSLCAGDCDSSPAQCKKEGGVWAGAEADQLCLFINDPASDTCCCYP